MLSSLKDDEEQLEVKYRYPKRDCVSNWRPYKVWQRVTKAKFSDIRNEYLSILTEKSSKEEITTEETEDLLYKQKAAFNEIIDEARRKNQTGTCIIKN